MQGCDDEEGAKQQRKQQQQQKKASCSSSSGVEAAPAASSEKVKCPRCDSYNTKFCYYNNYNLTQPRHFCRTCRRYWTKGGTLRNIPVGGGCRKSTHTPKSLSSSSSSSRLLSSLKINSSRNSATGTNKQQQQQQPWQNELLLMLPPDHNNNHNQRPPPPPPPPAAVSSPAMPVSLSVLQSTLWPPLLLGSAGAVQMQNQQLNQVYLSSSLQVSEMDSRSCNSTSHGGTSAASATYNRTWPTSASTVLLPSPSLHHYHYMTSSDATAASAADHDEQQQQLRLTKSLHSQQHMNMNMVLMMQQQTQPQANSIPGGNSLADWQWHSRLCNHNYPNVNY